MGQTLHVTKLQAVLASSTMADEPNLWHHPIGCYEGGLAMDEDGTLRCEHASASPDSRRTKACLNHSMAILLMEIAVESL